MSKYYFCRGNLELEQAFLETIVDIDSGVACSADRKNREILFGLHQKLLHIVPFITKA